MNSDFSFFAGENGFPDSSAGNCVGAAKILSGLKIEPKLNLSEEECK